MVNGFTGARTAAAGSVTALTPPALHGQSGGRTSALLRMRTMSRTLMRASTAHLWSGMLAAQRWKANGGARGGPDTGRFSAKLIARITSRMLTASSAFRSALATPLNMALVPEMEMPGSTACSWSGVRVIGRGGSRQQAMRNGPLPTPKENGRVEGCRAPPHRGPTDMFAVPL